MSLNYYGGGAFADPWHPFAATSERLADLLAVLGHHVEISDLVADRVADLRGWDLLGHDERSYDSAAQCELISRAARWLTRAL